MKKIVLILIAVVFVQLGLAQSLTPAAVTSGGETQKKGGASLSYSIGQVFTPTLNNSNYITQGVQQPEASQIAANPISKYSNTSLRSKIYPNPATDFVVAEFLGAGGNLLMARIVDVSGKLVSEEQVSDSSDTDGLLQVRVQTDHLPDGKYILSVFSLDSDAQFVSFKFYKR